jgi:hypothetical protein
LLIIIEVPLDLRRLKRMDLVAIGREFAADLCFGRAAGARLPLALT